MARPGATTRFQAAGSVADARHDRVRRLGGPVRVGDTHPVQFTLGLAELVGQRARLRPRELTQPTLIIPGRTSRLGAHDQSFFLKPWCLACHR